MAQTLAFPIVFANGQIQTVPQGSEADIAGCIAIVCSYTPGTRRGRPGFGVPELNFDDRVEVGALKDAVLANEPRAANVSASVLREAAGVAGVQLTFGGFQ
jgi:hypothetical protein